MSYTNGKSMSLSTKSKPKKPKPQVSYYKAPEPRYFVNGKVMTSSERLNYLHGK